MYQKETINTLNQSDLINRLKKPEGVVDVVFDSDTYNEIDDQYALAYLIQNSNKLKLKALYAAPYFNDHSSSPKDGMEKSYAEIKKLLKLMEKENFYDLVFKGSEMYLTSETEPVISDAAKDLADRAMNYTEEAPLYVIAIGAITNIASALLINPAIRDRIVIIWLGGHSFEWHDNMEFNMRQDIAAARIVLGCGAAIVLLPCMGVVSHFYTTGPELEFYLKGKNQLCDYLLDLTLNYSKKYQEFPTWARAIWDVTAVAWLLNPDFMLDRFEHSPVPEYDNLWAVDKTRHFIRYVYHINREKLFHDLFEKLSL